MRASTGAACLLAAAVAGCTALPADYAATLSTHDRKWRSPECRQARLAASNYKEKETGLAPVLLGPYGLAIMAAAKEHQEKQRKQLARELHLACSSSPLPGELQANSTTSS